jgi:hypothetical protein
MKLYFISFLFVLVLAGFSAWSQSPEEIAKGINLIETQTFLAEENAELLKLYEGLRVADVSDGMDMVVVPRKVARQVAEYAHNVLEGDKAGRRKLYEKLGIPFDPTVE